MSAFPKVLVHADCNAFYASVAENEYPQLRGKPLSVGGSEASRHGIILASNYIAKRYGIRTGMVNWQARQLCKNLQLVEIGDIGRELIRRYSDDFVDRCYDISPQCAMEGDDGIYSDWTGCVGSWEEAEQVAHKLRKQVKREMGITVSVGVSFTRSFAKLASDYKKPDACTIIRPDNWKEIVWPLPTSDLYWIGPATTAKLAQMGIFTIGQLAQEDMKRIHSRFGVVGRMLWNWANGRDDAPIAYRGERDPAKSVGNSSTANRDLVTLDDIHRYVRMLGESVSERMREDDLLARKVQIYLRYSDLSGYQRQTALPFPTRTSNLLCKAAMGLVIKHWTGAPLRSLEVRAIDIIDDDYLQLALLPEMLEDQKSEILDTTVQNIRRRMGHNIIKTGDMLVDSALVGLDIRSKHSAQSNAFRRF